MKKTNYFSHDSNARNDSKIIPLRMKLGIEGYGIYFMIIERLREESNYTCLKDYDGLAFDFRTTKEKIKSVIEDFDLFEFTDDGYFYSKSLKQRMLIKDEKSKKRSEAGILGNEKRWEKTKKKPIENQSVIANVSQCDENSSQVKESKVKESKLKERKVKEKKSEKKVEMLTTQISENVFESKKNFYVCIEQISQILNNDAYWLEVSAKSNQSTIEEIQIAIPKFILHLESSGVELKSVQDAKYHFNNWFRKIRQIEQQQQPVNDSKIGRISQREITDFIRPKKTN